MRTPLSGNREMKYAENSFGVTHTQCTESVQQFERLLEETQ
jgi:hypothetical protein